MKDADVKKYIKQVQEESDKRMTRYLGALKEDFGDQVQVIAEVVTHNSEKIDVLTEQVAHNTEQITTILGVIGVMNENIDVINENIDVINGNIDVINEKIDVINENVDVMKSDISIIKTDVKKKVDYDEFASLERRVLLLESKSKK